MVILYIQHYPGCFFKWDLGKISMGKGSAHIWNFTWMRKMPPALGCPGSSTVTRNVIMGDLNPSCSVMLITPSYSKESHGVIDLEHRCEYPGQDLQYLGAQDLRIPLWTKPGKYVGSASRVIEDRADIALQNIQRPESNP